jgi:hypothetical protein
MKLFSHLLLVLTVTLVTACGGGSQASEMAGLMDDITAVLKDVKDADSAKAAKAELEPLMVKFNDFAKNAPEGAGDDPKEIDPEEMKKMEAASTAYGMEIARILSNPALSEVLTETLVPTSK